GVPYWDGGFLGNPALFPFFYESGSEDIIIVQINPIERKELPETANDIQNRLNEITFNSALMGELRSIAFVSRLVDDGRLSHDEYKRPLMHRIGGGGDAALFSAASKFDTRWSFLKKLRDNGRESAQEWLKKNYDHIGARDTLNLRFAFS
ncbi:MAG: patatin-like phospholipase family protein, partial [Hyphomicrobiales bacterium]|nr:patatin-like phospholipase family protein [Hyphomicrobiales bacterium]